MALSLRQLQDVCLQSTSQVHKKCRYLAQDEIDMKKWYCLKKSSLRAEIDDEISVFLDDLKKKGLDPKRQGVALGDNCEGYPILKHISQGYDQ